MTNKLIQRINEVKRSGDLFKEQKNQTKLTNDMVVFIPKVRELYATYKTIYGQYINLRKILIDYSLDFQTLQNDLAQISTKMNNDSFDIDAINRVLSSLNRYYQDMSKNWKTYYNSRISAVDSMIEILGDLVKDMPEIQTMSRLRSELERGSIASIDTLECLRQYLKYNEVLADKLQLDDHIVRFLKLLSKDGKVILDLLDDEVLKWLKSTRFSEKLFIFPKIRK